MPIPVHIFFAQNFEPLQRKAEAYKYLPWGRLGPSFHCLLSIGNLNPSQLPSKVIEYISTGKPVIHFAEIANDPVIKISEKFENLIVVTKKSDPLSVNEQLTNVFQNIDKFDVEQFNNIYSAEAVTKKLNIF